MQKSATIAPGQPVSQDTALAESLIGKQIGDRYRILRSLGQGGMGAVYEVIQEETRHRAAVKILFPEYSREPRWVERLFKEAHAVNMTSHPGLVKIFSCGHADCLAGSERAAYILMEYLEGESLWRRLARLRKLEEQLSVDSALRLSRQIASALASVHEQGVIHRDLKPENVILIADPEVPSGERTKVVDFGIAKFDDNQASGAHHTTGGKVMGTPIYMSPEQCRGVPLSGRSDVYSLGVMLYEMLAGRPPFDHLETGTLMTMHIRDPPPSLDLLRPDVPDEVLALVDEMLRKEPLDRPAMVEIEDRIEGLEDQRRLRVVAPVPTLPDRKATSPASSSSRERHLDTMTVQPESRRGRRGLWVAAIAAIVFIGTLSGPFLRSRAPARSPAAVALQPATSAAAPIHPMATPMEPAPRGQGPGAGESEPAAERPALPSEAEASLAEEPLKRSAPTRRHHGPGRRSAEADLPRLPDGPVSPQPVSPQPAPPASPAPEPAAVPAASPAGPQPARRRRIPMPDIRDLSPPVPAGT